MTAVTAPTLPAPPRSWRRLLAESGWRQGEHVTILGPTGTGKTLLAGELLELRDWVLATGVKLEDRSLERLEDRHGFVRVDDWPPPPGERRVLLWPRFADRDDAVARGRDIIGRGLAAAVSDGGWTIYVDELLWTSERLNQRRLLEDCWQLGRSANVSLVVSSQRPYSVPQPALSQPTHLFLAGTSDERDLKRLAEIGGGLPKERLRELVSSLPEHSFLYVNTRDRRLGISRLALPTTPGG